jgi:hypothetical protein
MNCSSVPGLRRKMRSISALDWSPRNLGIGHRDAERFDHPRGQSETLQLPDVGIGRHVQVFDRPAEHAGKHGRLRVAVKQFRTIEVVSLSGMPLPQ